MPVIELPQQHHGKIHSEASLKRALDYIVNPEKTQNYELVRGHLLACPEHAFPEFWSTRELALKVGKKAKINEVRALHIVQSFSPDETLSLQEIQDIAYAFALEFTKGEHEFVIATHTDKAHIHTHIIINAVNMKSLTRLHLDNQAIETMREISDRIALEHGAHIIEPSLQNSHQAYAAYRAENSYRWEIKNRLNFLMRQAKNWSDFKDKAARLGLVVDDSGKYVAYYLQGSDQKRNIRDRSLGAKGRFLRETLSARFKKNQVVASPKEIKALYDAFKAKKAAEHEVRLLVEPWQVEKESSKYLYLKVDFGLSSSGTVRIPATKVDKREEGNYEIYLKKFDKFYFLDDKNHARSRLMYGATLIKQLSENSGQVPVYSNNALKRIHELGDSLNFLASKGVKGERTFKLLGEDLIEQLKDIQEALDVLDEKIIVRNKEATKTLAPEAIRQVKSLQAERKELKKAVDKLVKDLSHYQKIDRHVHQNKEAGYER